MQKFKPLWGSLLFIILLPLSTQALEMNLDSNRDTSKTTLRSPTGALFRSIAFPGWGQFYNKKYLKAAIVFLGEGSLIAGAVVEWRRMNEHKKIFEALPDTNPLKTFEFNQYQYHKDNRNLFLWWTAGVIFISMWDAYADAHLSSFEKEEKQEPRWGLVPETDLSHKEIKINLSFRF